MLIENKIKYHIVKHCLQCYVLSNDLLYKIYYNLQN